MRILLIDNFDSFTYNLQDYFEQLGATCIVHRNDQLDPATVDLDQYDVLVLSPGPMRPIETQHLMDWIELYEYKVPILGICLGHQAIGEHYGAHLVLAREPVHGKTSFVTHNGHPIFRGMPDEFEAMRYHSLLLEAVPKPLDVIAWTRDGEIMALAHQTLPIAGIQFHPESILTPDGLPMLENFLEWSQKPV